MGKISTPVTTSKKDEQNPLDPASYTASRQLFLASALSMSWQLAVVVLVPVIGGVKLDEHLHSSPLWTLLGFGLAMVGMTLVLWRALQALNSKVTPSPEAKK